MAYRTAIIGAGYISDIHAEVLNSLNDVSLTAVVDPFKERAEALARKWRAPHAFASIQDLIDSGQADVAHVLVPPNLHRAAAEEVLAGGLHTLLEKPMAESTADAQALLDAREKSGTVLGINQNFVFHPAYRRLKEVLDSGRLGRPHHVVSLTNVPLRQLNASQFGHWMFQQPQFILLEQAVHPLSQLFDLCGPADDLAVQTGDSRSLAHNLDFIGKWQVAFKHGNCTSQMLLAVGQDFPLWRITAICSDGAVTADILQNRCTVEESTRWPDFYDSWTDGRRQAMALLGQSFSNAADYVLSTVKLKSRSDPFYRSMRGSLAGFYAGLPDGAAPIDGQRGLELVQTCERIAEAAGVQANPPVSLRAPADDWDVTVLGGTGFIGRHLVRELLDRGHKVCVMARSTRGLPPLLHDPRVTIVSGDVSDMDAVERAIGKAKFVINLAIGASGSTPQEIEDSMKAGALGVARLCADKDVELLLYTSTIAALYLGDPDAVVQDATGTDPQREQRGEYARAKAATEEALLSFKADKPLPICIMRPGVVVGAGGIAFHSGLGFFNRDRYCLGWNRGSNPLPFVLADDVATAIATALERPQIAAGKTYNLVGDVRLTARDYIAELGRATGRPLRFHGHSVAMLQSVEVGKWLIKLASGRKNLTFPSYRDLKSRGMMAHFDCSAVKRDLDWEPENDRAAFVERAIAVHATEQANR